MNESILAQIAALRDKTTLELRVLWKELFDRDPPPYGRKILEGRLGYRIQELQLGGLSEHARRKLDALADRLDPKASRRPNPGRPIAGTKLVREWRGIDHHVTVLDDGFEWQGRRYQSPSGVARAITGTRWNGPLFFGLRQGGKAR